MYNPFCAGDPVEPREFLNRKRELRRITSRILSGQSVAIFGEPRSGKTSLLLYLAAPETRQTHYKPLSMRACVSAQSTYSRGSQ